jgi:hypothetical protein
MKHHDERRYSGEVCAACKEEFDPHQEGGADFDAPDREAIYFCESCAEEAKDAGLIVTDKPDTTPEGLTVEAFDKLAEWAKAQHVQEKPHPEDVGNLSKLEQTQAVLRDLAEWMIDARNGGDTHENNSGAIHGGVMHELLTRSNKILGGTLPNFD